MKRTPYRWQSAGVLFLILASACGGPITTVTPAAQSNTASPAATKAAPAAGAQSGAAPSAAAPIQGSTGGQPFSSGPVSLSVTAPQDGAVVNTPQLQVTGTASPGAVVTVNDTIIVVGADGGFSASIALDAGPNLVEVIASNSSGDSKTIDLTITYEQ